MMALIMTQKNGSGLRKAGLFGKKPALIPLACALLALSLPIQAEIPGFFKSDDASSRDLFIQAARKYLGTPYARGGTTAAGMDCSGLIYRAALDAFNAEVPRTASSLAARCERITDLAREPGDLVFFNTTGRISHVGIWLGGGTFIHAASDGPRTGVIISDISEDYWKRSYRYAGRILRAEGVKMPDTPEERAPAANPFPFGGEIGFRLNLTGGALWDFMPNEVPVRGAMANAEISWVKGFSAYPGLGIGVSWDDRSSSFSVPLTASLTTESGFRFFLGTQIHLTADSDLDRSPKFPGIIGLSWNSKPVTVAGQKVRFYQSAEYSWFDDETFNAGLRFDTGLTLSFDI
jgi:probable lipoprotein NlpC